MSINLKAFWGTLNNVSFHLKTAAMGALPLMISYVYIYNLFGNDAWQKELALVSYAQMMPQLALAHLVNVNQLMCSAAFLVAFLGLREECPDGSINDIPTLWSMLWFKTMCIYATQVGLYFAWPLMLLNGCGHTGGSFFGVRNLGLFFDPDMFLFDCVSRCCLWCSSGCWWRFARSPSTTISIRWPAT